MTITGNLATDRRLEWLLKLLESEGRVQITAAAEGLDVSEMTIRRDLQELVAQGLARRVRGGAVSVGPESFAERHRHRARAKSKIATKLLEMVPPTGAIGLDASSTVLRLATALQGAKDLSVVTNGPETFQALQRKPGIKPILTGGELEPRTGTLVGPVATRSASQLILKRFFCSAAAVDAELGASEATLEEAEVKRSLSAASGEVILAADSSKLDSRAFAVGVDWSHIMFLVTELDPSDAKLRAYKRLAEVV